jgi:uncharacterized membrane protein
VLVLLGVLVVIVGFGLKRNPLIVVTVAGIVTGLLGGLSPVKILDAFGTGFAGNRAVTLYVVTLPVIGLLERYGLQEQARRLIAKMTRLTTGRLLVLYLLARQITAAFGLVSVAGPAQTVRPLLAPMATGAAERRHGPMSAKLREKVLSFSASADTVGLFFGEDVFLAVGSILLIVGFVDTTYHLSLDALHVAVWAIPTAVCAFAIHGTRLLLLDRTISRDTAPAEPTDSDVVATREASE